jgi:hypothetical protein
MFNFLNDYTRNAPKSQGIYDQNGIYQSMELRRDCYFPIYNDSWFIGRNAANSADINIFKVDSSDRFNLNPEIMTDMWLGSSTNLFLGIGSAGAGNLAHSGGNDGYYNLIQGYQAGYSISTGGYNIGIGAQAMYYNQTGTRNIAVGYQSLFGVSGQNNSNNIAIGHQSGYGITTGHDNIIIGTETWKNITIAFQNVVIGNHAFGQATSGEYNVSVGDYSGYNLGTGGGSRPTYTTLIGAYAGYNMRYRSMTAIGAYSLYTIGSSGLYNGEQCTAVGFAAGYSYDGGHANCYFGYQAGKFATASNIIAIGPNTLLNNTGGDNIVIGLNACTNLTTGSGNVIIGRYSANDSVSLSASVGLGFGCLRYVEVIM